jgi:hypothetical protein
LLTCGDSTSSDDEGDVDSFNPSFSRTPSFESEATLVNESDPPSLRTVRPLRANGVSATGETSRAKSPAPSRPSSQKRSKHPSSSSTNVSTPTAMNGSPKHPEIPSQVVTSPQTERHRSNSESVVGSNREKRRGMPPPPRTNNATRGKPIFTPQSLGPVDEKPYKHTRGYSHDSVIDGGQSSTHVPSRSPVDNERRPGQYFRRLSSLPEHKRSSLSSARVGEAARGILYSMSTLQRPVEQYIESTGDPGGPESKVGRALYNSNMHVTSLVSALEAYEARDDEPRVQKVIDACQSCVAAFRQVLSMLQSSLKELGPGSSGPDVRYARTLILMIYGSYVEIQCSYDILRPLLLAQAVTDGATKSGLSRHQQSAMSISHSRQKTSSNNSITDSSTSQMSNQPSLATPRSTDASFAALQTPWMRPTASSQHSDSGFDQEGALYQKFQAATAVAISTLPQIDREIKSAATQNLQPPITLKLRKVSSLCTSGIDAARRLSKIRWEAIQDGDQNERKTFWDDTNKFTQVFPPIRGHYSSRY